jgi:hypothetical protein
MACTPRGEKFLESPKKSLELTMIILPNSLIMIKPWPCLTAGASVALALA